MDPNAALAEIRSLIDKGNLDSDEAERLVELVAGLDAWMSNGGFAPDAWGGQR